MADIEDDDEIILEQSKRMDFEEIVKEAELEQKTWEAKHKETVLGFPVTASLKISSFPFPKDKDGAKLKVKADMIGEYIRQQIPMAKSPDKSLYFYKDGVYVPEGVEAVEEILYQLLKAGDMTELWTPEYSAAVVKYVSVVSPKLWEKPLEDRINVKNGIVRWSTKELVPHTPEYLSTVQLPVIYDPEATCPKIEQFIKEVFPEDSSHIAWEIIGWMITSSNRIQKMIILDGAGNNGKSTFLNLVKNVLGQYNISNVSLQSLELDRFAPFSLYQKLANICGDIPNKRLQGTSVFKSITGGDPLRIEDKNKRAFSANIFAKLLFSTNDLIKSPDTSEGFYRKINIIPFHKVFPPNPKKARELEKLISDSNELSGVFNHAISALARIMNKGITVSKSVAEANEEFRKSTDPISEWIEENLEFGNFSIESINLYNDYKDYCRSRRISCTSKQGFGRAFSKLVPNAQNTTSRINGIPTKIWKGVRVKDVEITVS